MAEDARRRITQWLEAAPSVLDTMSRLLEEPGRLREAIAAAEHECTRLRQELAVVRAENGLLVKEWSEFDDRIADGLGKANDALLRFRASRAAPMVDSTASAVALTEPAAAPVVERAATPAPDSPAASPPEQPVEPGRRRILLVDDDASFKRMITDYLTENLGYEVLAAASGEEALTLLPRFQPHAVLLDLAMPGGGVWAIERIKTLHPDLCVFVVTGNDDASIERKARALGVADYVTKPFDLDDLGARLDIHMTRVDAGPALRWPVPVANLAATTPPTTVRPVTSPWRGAEGVRAGAREPRGRLRPSAAPVIPRQ